MYVTGPSLVSHFRSITSHSPFDFSFLTIFISFYFTFVGVSLMKLPFPVQNPTFHPWFHSSMTLSPFIFTHLCYLFPFYVFPHASWSGGNVSRIHNAHNACGNMFVNSRAAENFGVSQTRPWGTLGQSSHKVPRGSEVPRLVPSEGSRRFRVRVASQGSRRFQGSKQGFQIKVPSH